MTVPTTSWDETSPAGSDQISQGDDRIREAKTQIREVIAVDHKFDSSGTSAYMGYHTNIHLTEAEDIGTGTTGYPILGAQTDTTPELTFTDESDNDVQITKGGYLQGDSLVDGSYDFQSTNLKYALIDFLYPVGTIYTEYTGTNPNTTFGRGTWAAIGSGTVLIGQKASDSDFDTAGETGGAKTATLTTTELPAHTHTVSRTNDSNTGGTGALFQSTAAAEDSATTSSTGSGSAFSILNPYTVVYFWRRTA